MSASGLTLSKGGHLTLDKGIADDITLGLGWVAHPSRSSREEIDPDAVAFGLKSDGKVPSDDWFIFYNQTDSPDGTYNSTNPPSIHHMGDDRGSGNEIEALHGVDDSEQIQFLLSKIPSHIVTIPLCVTIFEANDRKHNFGMLDHCYIRVFATKTGVELGRYDLSEDASTEDAMVFGQLVRTRSGWRFEANSVASSNGLYGLAKDYGVEL